MAVELPSIAFFFFFWDLTVKVCPHFSKTNFWVKILKAWPLKIVLFISHYLFKILSWAVYLGHKYLDKHFQAIKVSIRKYIWMHLQTTKLPSTQDKKWNWHFIRHYSILNVFKCLHYHVNYTSFVYFSWHPVWTCYAVRYVHFPVPSGKIGSSSCGGQISTFGSTFINKIVLFSVYRT